MFGTVLYELVHFQYKYIYKIAFLMFFSAFKIVALHFNTAMPTNDKMYVKDDSAT
jgi:hypothetical protein